MNWRQSGAVIGSILLLGGCGSSPAAAPAAVERVDPAAFATRVAATKGVVVDVHVPETDEIPGTTYRIPYDHIVGDQRLPTDHAAEVLVYCRSGNMSAVATKSLIGEGYTRVVELIGGYNAWKASGRPMRTGD